MSIAEFAEAVNEYGSEGTPFLFLVDFEMAKPLLFRLDEIDPDKLCYDINGVTNCRVPSDEKGSLDFKKYPTPFSEYQARFNRVRARLAYGDSYLANLTVRTRVETPLTLREIFAVSSAPYKVLFENTFVVFSPETFIKVSDGKISAYPMKGTMDASIPSARKIILSNEKEMAEHVTIVDLLRNDLSTVADNVTVTRFRYIDEIKTGHKNLLQVSSEITGKLPPGYRQCLGDMIVKLLPAGSVSGAPKCKTMEIIREAECGPRGYYTGVVGLFDGFNLDSGVMIRFLERDHDTLYYRSGGGITMQSDVAAEYQETIDKVYVPID